LGTKRTLQSPIKGPFQGFMSVSTEANERLFARSWWPPHTGLRGKPIVSEAPSPREHKKLSGSVSLTGSIVFWYRGLMGRPKRSSPGGWVYHVLNRANARMPIFTKDEDFVAFERVLEEAVAPTGTPLLSYCLVKNHWHMVVLASRRWEAGTFCGLVDADSCPAMARASITNVPPTLTVPQYSHRVRSTSSMKSEHGC